MLSFSRTAAASRGLSSSSHRVLRTLGEDVSATRAIITNANIRLMKTQASAAAMASMSSECPVAGSSATSLSSMTASSSTAVSSPASSSSTRVSDAFAHSARAHVDAAARMHDILSTTAANAANETVSLSNTMESCFNSLSTELRTFLHTQEDGFGYSTHANGNTHSNGASRLSMPLGMKRMAVSSPFTPAAANFHTSSSASSSSSSYSSSSSFPSPFNNSHNISSSSSSRQQPSALPLPDDASTLMSLTGPLPPLSPSASPRAHLVALLRSLQIYARDLTAPRGPLAAYANGAQATLEALSSAIKRQEALGTEVWSRLKALAVRVGGRNNSAIQAFSDKKDVDKEKDNKKDTDLNDLLGGLPKKISPEEMSKLWDDLRKSMKPKGSEAESPKDGEKDGEKDKDSDSSKESSGQKDGDKEKDSSRRSGIEEDEDDIMKMVPKLLASLVLFMVIFSILSRVSVNTNSFVGFKELLKEGQVTQIIVNENTVYAHYKQPKSDRPHVFIFNIASQESFERKLDETIKELGLAPIPLVFQEPTAFMSLISTLTSVGLLVAFIYFMSKSLGGKGGRGMGGGRGILGFGKSNPVVVVNGKDIKVSFKDVAGLDQAKVEIMELVQFLQHPAKFKQIGARIPKGALLVGPPGTGKTLLAKATAGEAKVPFYSVSGSDFLEMFVGVGASRVRDLFAQARKNAPSIIFIDEIDAIGKARSGSKFASGGNDERETTLNQMLVEMDGFASGEGVIVLAGTNRAELLDPALLRPGRFDRQIPIDRPDIKGRIDIFKVHLKPLKLAADADDIATKMAALTPGMVGADIANVCNEAAIFAARGGKNAVELVDFEMAVDRVIAGIAKVTHVMAKEERRIVAYHEAGHAIVGWFLENAEPLLKVTIVPRTSGALGFAQYLPKEISLYQVPQLQDRIAMALGGRAAEQVMFGMISSGAADDIKKTTQIATSMVTKLGMSPRLMNMSFNRSDEDEFIASKPYSDATAVIIDEEVRKIVDEQYKRAISLLTEKRSVLEKLAEALLEKETLNHDALVEILGPRPFVTDAYKQYMDVQREAKELEVKRKAEEEEAKKKVAEAEAAAAADAAAAASPETATEAGEKAETAESSAEKNAEKEEKKKEEDGEIKKDEKDKSS